jgi:hypothetical protein
LESARKTGGFSWPITADLDHVIVTAAASTSPEPSTLVLGGIAVVGGIGTRLRRRRAA